MSILLIIGLSALFFVIDIMTPLGIAGGVPQIIPVLFSYKLKDKKAILYFSILGSLLIIAAFFFSPSGGQHWQVMANRFLALFAVWTVAFACLKIKKEKEKLHILNDAINQSPNPIAITDKNAKIEYVNPAFLKKSGYSEKELIGNNPRIIKSGKHSEDFYRELWKTINSGNIWADNIFNKRKDGTLYWESLQISPLKNTEGEITHFLSLRMLDKQMEVAQRGIGNLNHTLDQIPQAVLMTDRQGFIVYANPAFEEVTGYSLNEVIGMNPNILKSGEQTPEFYEQLWKTISTGESWKGEFWNKKKNGELYWERAVISPVYNDKNKISHFIALRNDVTEEKQKADKFQKLSKIVEGSPISILITDTSGNIEYANRSLLETSGYSLDEIIGKNSNIFKSGETPSNHYEKLWDRIAAGHDWRGVFHNKKKNGELYWESVLITPFLDEKGNVTNYVALKENISDKKRLESTLIDHERLISSVINNLMYGLIITNMDGNIHLFNKGAEKIFGYKAEEVLDQPVVVLMDDFNKKRHESGFEKFQKRKKISTSKAFMEVVGTRKDGSPVPIELTLTQMEQRGQVFVIGMVRDISDRKEAEKKRRKTEEQLELVLQGAEIYYWDWNVKTGKVIHDPRWVEFLGYPEGKIMSTLQQCKELVHPEDLPNFLIKLDDHIKGNSEFLDVEYRALKHSGEWIWISDKGRILEWDIDGKPLRAYGTYLIIQDRKDTEKRINAAQNQLIAAEKLAGIGELAAGVSHEVLNPVNILSVNTQLLQKKTKDDPNIQKYCSKVMHEIERIQKIMSSLLAFSRKGSADFEKGYLKDSIEKVLNLVEEEYRLDNIKIERKWCEKPVKISYDPDKMRQVFLNLLQNSKHAMPDGGTITVGCNVLDKSEKPFHQFTFSDTGKGMNEETQLRIFEPFFTTKPEGQGTGMGLSIIHGIIKEHKGKIRVESEEGKGTTFTISFPVA